jgi:rhodanese-related sulfurtransferase
MGAGVGAGLAGCAGGDSDTPSGDDTSTQTDTAPFEHPGTLSTSFAANGDYPTDDDPADGRPPSFGNQPPRPDADPDSFETLDVNGETVSLAPIGVVEQWYRRGEIRVVDARGLEQYEQAHVYGAVLSPAQRDSVGGGINGWPSDDRVVTYCRCPHHLSSIRAAGLQKAGFEEVYAIDEGFGVWAERSYPMAGTSFGSADQASVEEWSIAGSVDSRYAGEYVWATVDRQYEAAPIGSDGRYKLHLQFTGVSPKTPVRLQTPTGTVERPLGEVGSRV